MLFHLIPFGGVTLWNPTNAVARWRLLVFAAAGLLVNVTAAAMAWCVVAPGALFSFHAGNLGTTFFWANVLVLVGNLFPHQTPTPYGVLDSDGLLLWKLLFRWNKPFTVEPVRLPFWELAVRHLLKWTVFVVMVGAVLLFLLVAVVILVAGNGTGGWELKAAVPAIMLGLALAAGWAAVRIAHDPVSTVETPRRPAGFSHTVSLSSEQDQLVVRAIKHAERNEFAEAEGLLDRALAGTTERSVAERWPLALLKLEYILAQNDVERAEKACREWVNQAATTEEKVRILDGFASEVLYTSTSSALENAERLVRKALELAPGCLTLKGSLGGILAELGRYAEAEPLLHECLSRSPAFHDQGIAAFYLGLARFSTGDRSEAKRLIKRAMVLHPATWLMTKAEAKLKEFGR